MEKLLLNNVEEFKLWLNNETYGGHTYDTIYPFQKPEKYPCVVFWTNEFIDDEVETYCDFVYPTDFIDLIPKTIDFLIDTYNSQLGSECCRQLQEIKEEIKNV
jgi:hypothetical protein